MKTSPLSALTLLMACLLATAGVNADSVTPDVIMGDGIANGSFTVDRNQGVELGLRAKLRYDSTGLPQNTFNYDGVDTYTFSRGVAPTQSFPTAVWSFEWSINSDYTGTSDTKLADLTYSLWMTSSTGSAILAFDPINDGAWDHSIGDNSTTESTDHIATSAADYDSLIHTYNVAQNSWKPHWFADPFDPTLLGTYDFTLAAFDGATQVASTSMTVQVVPLPMAVWAGLPLLGGLAGWRTWRRKNAIA